MAEQAPDFVVRASSGEAVDLSALDPGFTGGLDRDEAGRRLKQLAEDLDALQELLYGAAAHSVLVILQGMDASGKDGAIRHVFSRLNPQGCHAIAFKVPTEEEAAHDFLWRIHKQTPPRGMIAVFNRSQYEDVLVPRVHQLVAPQVWQRRYDQINEFERLLSDAGTILIKFFLHISKREQEKRLREREVEPEKAWKLSVDDWKDRAFWDAYQEAYQDAIARCSSDVAPWYIVPADHKWFRDLAVATVLHETLERFRDGWRGALAEESARRLAELRRYRADLTGSP